MSSVFKPPKVKADPSVQKAQRRQSKNIDDQTAEEARELGSRRRLQNARRTGSSSLFAKTGGAGVQDTLG